ncbi:hypothetical protein AUJ46_04790 [Candidatus Peregrinibacteria bacterium CG1_02_54_53]|nr:MAG: hypothetical protein AUJ46_04790 [Candidatus Peregrinibacteria bacterium CG1_02_54_53]
MTTEAPLPLRGPVPLPEGQIPQDEELRALLAELEVATSALADWPGSALVHELHRVAARKYRNALTKRGVVIRE